MTGLIARDRHFFGATHVQAVTEPYKYHRGIAFIAEIPKTVTGKIRRRTLRDLEFAPAGAAKR